MHYSGPDNRDGGMLQLALCRQWLASNADGAGFFKNAWSRAGRRNIGRCRPLDSTSSASGERAVRHQLARARQHDGRCHRHRSGYHVQVRC